MTKREREKELAVLRQTVEGGLLSPTTAVPRILLVIADQLEKLVEEHDAS